MTATSDSDRTRAIAALTTTGILGPWITPTEPLEADEAAVDSWC
ncbi:hypothetical protein [Cellulomonas hominis]